MLKKPLNLVILTRLSEQPYIHLFCIKMFLEAIPTRLQSLKKFHEKKLEIARRKKRKIQKKYDGESCWRIS